MKLASEQYDVYEILIHEVYIDSDWNCRGDFSLDTVEELADSIDRDGLLFPIVVQPAVDVADIPEGFRFRLVAGFRRFTACRRILKWETIPANIRTGLTERQARIINLKENLERKDLNILEEATSLDRLFPHHRTVSSIAKELNRTNDWVRNRRILLSLPKFVQLAAASGRLSDTDLKFIIDTGSRTGDYESVSKKLLAAAKQGRKYHILSKGRHAKPKAEVQAKMAELLKEGFHPNLLRLMGWCIGEIDDDTFQQALVWLRDRKVWLR